MVTPTPYMSRNQSAEALSVDAAEDMEDNYRIAFEASFFRATARWGAATEVVTDPP